MTGSEPGYAKLKDWTASASSGMSVSATTRATLTPASVLAATMVTVVQISVGLGACYTVREQFRDQGGASVIIFKLDMDAFSCVICLKASQLDLRQRKVSIAVWNDHLLEPRHEYVRLQRCIN